MKKNAVLLAFPQPQVNATFLTRPQRFLAEVKMSNAKTTLIYCANPGSLKGCLASGSAVLLWDSGDAERKRRYTWRAIKIDGVWVGTDTHLTNHLVETALRHGIFRDLISYTHIKKEHRADRNSRIDFLLRGPKGKCFIEVKSVTVAQAGTARFPDSVTPRSLRQLKYLTTQARQGHRAILMFAVQRGDVKKFSINELAYPEYARAIKLAARAGVEIVAWKFPVSPRGFGVPLPLKIV